MLLTAYALDRMMSGKYALAHDVPPPKTFDDVISNEQAVSLRELRRLTGRTQLDVADEMGVAQGEISRLERREDANLSTLRTYVDALGGKIELTAKDGDRSVPRMHFSHKVRVKVFADQLGRRRCRLAQRSRQERSVARNDDLL